MPTSVRLDDRTEAILRRLARQKSLSRSEVIREAIVAYGEAQDATDESPLYDRIQHVIGVFGGRPDLSQDTGQKFHDLLVEDQRRERRGNRRRK